MSNNKLMVIVFILAFSLCAETIYLFVFTQPILLYYTPVETIDPNLIGFISNSSAKFQINNGHTPVTLMDWVMVNGMNSTLTSLEYSNTSIPIDGSVKFIVTLNGENHFTENVEYTFVIRTVHGTYFYETREFNTESIIE